MLLAAILLNTKTVDFVVTGCGTGEGAMLAAFFSKSRMSSQVPVDYTKKKNIKKPNGAKPGMVIYETNSTIYVTPTEELVAKYEERYQQFKEIYPACKPLYDIITK